MELPAVVRNGEQNKEPANSIDRRPTFVRTIGSKIRLEIEREANENGLTAEYGLAGELAATSVVTD